MLKKVALVLSTFLLALTVLSVSILRCSSIKTYVFSAAPSPTPEAGSEKKEILIDYVLPYQGKIYPDSPLWFVKVIRDRLWYGVTTNSSRKAELLLLFADKRLLAAKVLFEKDKPSLAVTTLTKAEKYLERAVQMETKNRQAGIDNKEFLTRLANASLKHWQVIEEILIVAPEDAKPEVIKVEDYAKNAYKETRDGLQSQGIVPPKNPIDSN